MSKSFPSLVPSQKPPAWGSAHSKQFSTYPWTWHKQVQNEVWSWSRTGQRHQNSNGTELAEEARRGGGTGSGETGQNHVKRSQGLCNQGWGARARVQGADRQTDKDNDSSQGKARLKVGIGVTSPPPNTANQTGGSGWCAILVELLASDKGQVDHRIYTTLSEGI